MNIYDSENPCFNFEDEKLCGICGNKPQVTPMDSMKQNIFPDVSIPIYKVLESISKFNFSNDDPRFICDACCNRARDAFGFQQMCNKAQSFFDTYTLDQQQLQKKGHSDTEETNVDIKTGIESETEALDNKLVVQSSKRVQIYPTEICKVCNKSFQSKNMKKHMRRHSIRVFKCNYCEINFSSRAKRRCHVKTVHYQIALIKNRRKFKCRFCRKIFFSRKLKSHHEHQKHYSDKEYKCIYCEAIFYSEKMHTRHLAMVHNRLAFVCELCDKSFNFDAELKVHLKVHVNPRSHECQECGESFTRALYLKEHIAAYEATGKCLRD